MNSQKTISKIFGHQQDPRSFRESPHFIYDTLLGIETELEYITKPRVEIQKLTWWEEKREGSIKGPGHTELGFKLPLGTHDTYQALEELESFIRNKAGIPILGSRTSLHIHLDMRGVSIEQVEQFFWLWLIFERVLYNYCSQDRKYSPFCVPFYKSLAHLQKTKNSLLSLKEEGLYAPGEKYSGLQLNSLQKFGSLEIRIHQGEWRKAPIIQWINILLSLNKSALESVISPNKILENFSVKGPRQFLTDIFGNLTPQLLYPSIDEDLYKGIRDFQYLQSSSVNYLWELPPNNSPDPLGLFKKFEAKIKRRPARGNVPNKDLLF